MVGIGFEDRAEAGQQLADELEGRVHVGATIVVAVSAGGREVAASLVDEGQPVLTVDTLAALGDLPDARGRCVLLVDDGERPPEEIAAAAWALKWIRPEHVVVAAPIASRWLEAALPDGVEVITLRRYTPQRDGLFLYGDDEQRFEGRFEPTEEEPPPRRQLPPRTGRPWDADEEARLDALVREGKPLPEIATALGRTRGGVSSRIAQLAIRRGAVSPPAM